MTVRSSVYHVYIVSQSWPCVKYIIAYENGWYNFAVDFDHYGKDIADDVASRMGDETLKDSRSPNNHVVKMVKDTINNKKVAIYTDKV